VYVYVERTSGGGEVAGQHGRGEALHVLSLSVALLLPLLPARLLQTTVAFVFLLLLFLLEALLLLLLLSQGAALLSVSGQVAQSLQHLSLLLFFLPLLMLLLLLLFAR
jgi:hypothetical protein